MKTRLITSILILLFLISAMVVVIAVSAKANKPTSNNMTLTSPNPLGATDYSGGLYGYTVATGGRYIFVFSH
jgi:hypothetical protein